MLTTSTHKHSLDLCASTACHTPGVVEQHKGACHMQSSLICGYMQAQITHLHSSAHNYACATVYIKGNTFISSQAELKNSRSHLTPKKETILVISEPFALLSAAKQHKISLNMQLKLFSVLYNCNLHVFFCIILNFIKLDVTLGKPNTNASCSIYCI